MDKAINERSFDIDEFCTGLRWAVSNEKKLIRLIATVLMGQHTHAARIITELLPAAPAFVFAGLKQEALIRLTVQKETVEPRTGYPRIQRDGLLFELITWLAAKEATGDSGYLIDPHTSSTTQGLDGLLIELSAAKDDLDKVVIYEDKCTSSPRKLFREDVLPGFLERHSKSRNTDLLSAASSLISNATHNDDQVMTIAKKVFDNSYRYYQANFALQSEFEDQTKQQGLFKNYEQLESLTKEQRIGASLIVGDDLRAWFDELANKVIGYIQGLEEEVV